MSEDNNKKDEADDKVSPAPETVAYYFGGLTVKKIEVLENVFAVACSFSGPVGPFGPFGP